MAAKKVGELIKEARNNAGLSQEKLATAIDGLSTSDVGKAERGEKDLTNDQLKAIAKMTGVTQKSLLEAPKNLKSTASKNVEAKTASKKTSGKTSARTSSSAPAGTSMKVSATEKKLIEPYREADSEAKKKVMNILKGKEEEGGDLLNVLLGSALGEILKK